MLLDIHEHHLYFFKTVSGFGEEPYTEENIMLRKTGVIVNGYEFVINDFFRIVHDIFGHAMHGNSFGPIGEDRAWFDHMNMFTPLAAAALALAKDTARIAFAPRMLLFSVPSNSIS